MLLLFQVPQLWRAAKTATAISEKSRAWDGERYIAPAIALDLVVGANIYRAAP